METEGSKLKEVFILHLFTQHAFIKHLLFKEHYVKLWDTKKKNGLFLKVGVTK